jgi:hypothetical protein
MTVSQVYTAKRAGFGNRIVSFMVGSAWRALRNAVPSIHSKGFVASYLSVSQMFLL